MTRLIFVRHGESTYNLSETYCGQIDCPLSEVGYLQSHELKEYILSSDLHIDEIWSSDLQRARSTVAPIAKALSLPVRLHAGLREINCGDLTDMPRSVAFEKYADLLDTIRQNRADFIADLKTTYPNGESYGDVFKRALTAVREICAESDGKTVLIAAHAGTIHLLIRSYYSTLEQAPPDDIDIWNCTLVYFDYDGEKLTYVKSDEVTCKHYGMAQERISKKFNTLFEI